jgi:membrane-bound lytic murein transglycosylase A
MLRTILTAFIIYLGTTGLVSPASLLKAQILKPIQDQTLEKSLGQDEQLWGKTGDKAALLKAIDYSLDYLKTAKAIQDYQNYPVHGVTRERVRRSLLRFRTLLQQSTNAEALERAVKQEFVWYESAGKDGLGTVHFTGYFEPIYRASRQRTSEYIYPLYQKPANFSTWTNPHPTRQALEGKVLNLAREAAPDRIPKGKLYGCLLL